MSDKLYRLVPYNFDALEPYVIVGRREMLVEVVPDYEAAAEAVEQQARKFPTQPTPSGSIGWGATPMELATVAVAAALEGDNDEPV